MSREDTKKLLGDLLEDLANEDYIDYESDDDELAYGTEEVPEVEENESDISKDDQEKIFAWLDSIRNMKPLQTFDVEIEKLGNLELDLNKAQWDAKASNPAKEWSEDDIEIQIESWRQKRFDRAVELYESRGDRTLKEGYDDYALSYASCYSNLPVDKIKELIDKKRGSKN